MASGGGTGGRRGGSDESIKLTDKTVGVPKYTYGSFGVSALKTYVHDDATLLATIQRKLYRGGRVVPLFRCLYDVDGMGTRRWFRIWNEKKFGTLFTARKCLSNNIITSRSLQHELAHAPAIYCRAMGDMMVCLARHGKKFDIYSRTEWGSLPRDASFMDILSELFVGPVDRTFRIYELCYLHYETELARLPSPPPAPIAEEQDEDDGWADDEEDPDESSESSIDLDGTLDQLRSHRHQ